MLVLARGRLGTASARVLEQVRRSGSVTREEVIRLTGLSPATVARTVTALSEAGLVREGSDTVRERSVGRPSFPVEIDTGRHSVLGVHVGRRVTTVGLVDLEGRVVGQSRLRTQGDADHLAGRVARHANLLLSDADERTVLGAGLIAPWGELAYDEVELTSALVTATGLDVDTAHHVAAAAAAEYLGRKRFGDGCTAYVYARETAGFALANDLPDRTEISRVATLTHFPTRSRQVCACGAAGCFAAVASDQAVAEQAHRAGIVEVAEIDRVLSAAREGDRHAHQILLERAEVLGATTAVLRDMIGPDQMVLVGQAFTGYPPVLDRISEVFADRTTLPPLDLAFTRFGTGVQAAAAGAVALGPVYEDPLTAVGRPAVAAAGLHVVRAKVPEEGEPDAEAECRTAVTSSRA